MKQLLVDIGNTRIRAAIFEDEQLLEFFEWDAFTLDQWRKIKQQNQIDFCLISSVSAIDLSAFKDDASILILGSDTKLPFENLYKSPLSLGADRKALVAAALHFNPMKNCLVIDAGTCVTYDMLDQSGNYLGGGISPGLHMRLKAMHHFTGKLPLSELTEQVELIGNDTLSCLNSGAYWGLIGEISFMIQQYEEKFDGLEVLLTGGDAEVLSMHLKRPLFVNRHLIMFGLNKILNFNVKKGV